MSKMKDEDIERNYREAGLTASTIARISEWIQTDNGKKKECGCDCGCCDFTEEPND
jgi:hypothetical protein